MSSGSPSRDRREVLPPLREVIPEMHTTRVDPDSSYPRTLDDSPLGPTTRASASGLAPSPLNGSASRTRPQYASQLSQHSGSSFSSNLPLRPGSYASQGSSSSRPSTTRSSPAMPPAPAMSSSGQSVDYRDQRNLPPISTYGEPSRAMDPRYVSSPTSARHPTQTFAGMQAQDYGGRYAPAPVYAGSSASGGYPLNFDGMSDYGDGRQKKRRGNLPKHVTDILRNWFQDHIAHPYPTEDEKLALMHITELTMSQISNWFINARRRSLPQMTRQAQAEQELRESQAMQMAQGRR